MSDNVVTGSDLSESQGERALEAAKIVQDIISGYTELTYKILLAHTTLMVAVCYFSYLHLKREHAYYVAVPVFLLGSVFGCWLWMLKRASERHVRAARLLWEALGVHWHQDHAKRSRLGSMWTPILVFAGTSTIGAALFIVFGAHVA